MKYQYIFALLPGALLILILTMGAALGYRFNVTQSLPLGIWQKIPYSKQVKYIEFCLPGGKFTKLIRERNYLPHGYCPGGLAPLLKPVVAYAGDVVVITDKNLTVNGNMLIAQGIAPYDSQGRALPHMPIGKYIVPDKSLWVISTYHPRSLDSRYYGVVLETNVIGGMRPVLVFNQRKDYVLFYQ